MENPEKCSKEKRDEVMLKVAKALKKIFEKHESITTAHIYGAQEDVTFSEDESEGEDETTGDEPEWEDEPEKEKMGNKAYRLIQEKRRDRPVTLFGSDSGDTSEDEVQTVKNRRDMNNDFE